MTTAEREIVIPYKPRPLQAEFHEQPLRWVLEVCHRRFGKTVMCINKLIRDAMTNTAREPRYGYVAPFFSQAKQIAWDYLKHYSRPIPGIQINEAELRIDYPNGARVRLYGADNPDILRGIYLDGVILDEYGQMKAELFHEVIRPTLIDREGYACIIGTPNGQNEFFDLFEKVKHDPRWFVRVHKASETGLIPPEELEMALQQMGDDQYQQEFECSFATPMQGSILGQWIEVADDEGRILSLPFTPGSLVNTCWDLGGGSDPTAIWWMQEVGPWIHVIDYWDDIGNGLIEVAREVIKRGNERKMIYGTHITPHDMAHREPIYGKTRQEMMREVGLEVKVLDNHAKVGRYELARQFIDRCRFDKDRCQKGLKALRAYAFKWDKDRKIYSKEPHHNWACHGADAFGYGAVGWEGERPLEEPMESMYSGRLDPETSWMGV